MRGTGMDLMARGLRPIGLSILLTLAAPAAWAHAQSFPPTAPTADAEPYGPPLAPRQPRATTRPDAWPGGAAGLPMPKAARPAALDGVLLAETQIIARIGPDVILASDILGSLVSLPDDDSLITLQFILDQIAAQIDPSQLADHRQRKAWNRTCAEGCPACLLDERRATMMRNRLTEQIDTRLVYADAKKKIPQENLGKVESRYGEEFEKTELKKLMRRGKVESPADLDALLVKLGTSLERVKRAYIEQTLAADWVRSQIKFNEEITHEQFLTYYRENLAEFEITAKARWEQLMVRFERCASKEEAYQKLAAMGNQVHGGAAWAQVAKAGSDGATASDGGAQDWTTQGSLVSQVLDRAIFTLPVGQMSPILEDEQGFHIVRVVQRQEHGWTPFTEAQQEIRKKIRKTRVQAEIQTYLAKLQDQTAIWTTYGNIATRPAKPSDDATRRR
ncbi:MAG: peptidylprolyl isomerase [Pirellulales bacterium]